MGSRKEVKCEHCGWYAFSPCEFVTGERLICKKDGTDVSQGYRKLPEQKREPVYEIPKRQSFDEAPKAPALDTQVGGSHYKDMAIQPMTYSMVNGLDACQHTIIKYVSRFRQKNGIEDLEKAKHCLDLLIEFEKAKLEKAA